MMKDGTISTGTGLYIPRLELIDFQELTPHRYPKTRKSDSDF